MKKTLQTIVAVLAVSCASAQVSVPNGGFEHWNVTTWYDLVGYVDNNSQNIGKGLPANTIRDAAAYHGNYALTVYSLVQNGDSTAGYVLNGNATNSGLTGGIPYSQNPTGIRFHYKYSRVNPNDSGVVIVQLKNSGSIIGGALIKLGPAATYTLYTGALPHVGTPDTLLFGVVSTVAVLNNQPVDSGSVLTIDSVLFTGGVSQPANFNGDFEQWTSDSFATLNQWQVSSNYPLFYRSTDAYTGKYALQASSFSQPSGNNGNGPDSSYEQVFSTGTFGNFGTVQGGYPFSNQIDTLEFYYKYSSGGIGDDSASVNMTFKQGGVLFPGSVGMWLPPAATYTRVRVPFNLGSTPDSVIITLQTQKTFREDSTYANGNLLTVDNMRFLSQSVPVVAADSGGPVACVGAALQYADTSQNGVTSRTWTFTGGSIGTSGAQRPSVTYSAAGKYVTKLVVNNSAGTDSIIDTINVVTHPYIAFSGNSTICAGNYSNITVSGGSTYSWSTTSTNDTINVSPASTTSYSVHVVAPGGCSADSGVSVTVNYAPSIVSALATHDTVCAGGTINLIGSAVGAASWSWSGPNSFTSASQSPSITGSVVGDSGMYILTATNGCGDSLDSVNVVVEVCTGVTTITNTPQINVYPNPSNGIFTIELSGTTGNNYAEVYNILGDKVFTQVLSQTSNDHIVDMSNKPAGIYFYRIIGQSGAELSKGKLIIK
jgi:hypothetical protein